MGGNGVPQERAVASTVTISFLTIINIIGASHQNPQISLSNYPTAARCRCQGSMNLRSHLLTGNDFTETVQIVGAQEAHETHSIPATQLGGPLLPVLSD